MQACRRQPVDRVPIWLMRQAGRYMAEYRAVREKTTFLELCKNPSPCAEVMITAVNRLGVDAAIIFSDLLPILEPMGLKLEFTPGDGPVIHNPLVDGRDVERFRELETVEPLDFVMQTVKLTRQGLPETIPVLGFAGAVHAGQLRDRRGREPQLRRTRWLMFRDEGAWCAIMERLARAVTRYLNAQIAAGAQAVQLFDSWVGCLGPEDYRRFVLPHTKAVIDGITPGVPVIHFATGNPSLLPQLAAAGGQVIGIDWRIELDEAWRIVGHDRAVQGNLDPAVLLAEPDEIRRRARDVLRRRGRPRGTHLQPGARSAGADTGRSRAVAHRSGARVWPAEGLSHSVFRRLHDVIVGHQPQRNVRAVRRELTGGFQSLDGHPQLRVARSGDAAAARMDDDDVARIAWLGLPGIDFQPQAGAEVFGALSSDVSSASLRLVAMAFSSSSLESGIPTG